MQSAYAFVLMGPIHDDEKNLNLHDANQTLPNGPFTTVTSANMTDDLGGPKHIKEFYRWNTPHLVYGFDREFVRFFGEEGILAVNDAMRALNDFFEPEDGQYSGVSELDLMRHGFYGNYSTYWLNITAKNENLMDIKSLVLGMMVNYLGLGNPYRHMFTATNAWYPDILNPGSVVLGTTLKNFDPITLKSTDFVNGDQYAYRLIHDQVPGFLPDPGANAGAGNVSTVTLDMEEFTNSDSVNTYSAVSAIVDAFYGNTDMVWTRVPSRYGFGIYYDGLNAMGGSYKPRHALTFDDAGGLKYMYNTNTVVMEFNPYALVTAADYTRTIRQYNLAPYNDPLLNRIGGAFPTRNATGVSVKSPQSHPLYNFMNPRGPGPDMVYNTADDVLNLLTEFMTGTNPGFVSTSGANAKTPGKMAWAFRGGIDSIQLHPISYDSLLNLAHYPTNYTWVDTFMTNANIRVPNLMTVTNTAPGSAIALTEALSNYYQQTLTRAPESPDFIFSASQVLGNQGNQVQTAWIREAPVDDWSYPILPGTVPPPDVTRFTGFNYNRLYYTETAGAAGPGIWAAEPGPYGGAAPYDVNDWPGLHMVFNSSINIGGFEVVWSGESSVVGNQILPIQYQQWAWIKGPGPVDFTKFPRDYDVSNRLIENTILPITGVPLITMVSDNGGLTSIAPTSLSRTEEKITMIGTSFLSATAIEVVDPSGAVVQVFSPADSYVKHDKLIEIPADTFGYKSEGLSRQMRVWNPVGPSQLSQEKFNINSGRPQVYSTSSDGVLYDRSAPLTITGTGFKSKQIHINDNNATITHIRVDDLSDGQRWPIGGIPAFGNDVSSKLEVLSDKKAIIHGDVFPSSIDSTSGIRIRVSRGSVTSLSPPSGTFIPGVTGPPVINNVTFMDDDTNLFHDVNETNPLRRDAPIIIDGSGLNSVSSLEIVRMDGYSFTPPVRANLETHANILSSGTRVTLQKNAFTESSADGHTSFRAKLRLVSPFGVVTYSRSFSVNIQPPITIELTGPVDPIDPSQISPADGNVWNRDPSLTGNGMDLEFEGEGLKVIQRIHIVTDATRSETGAFIDIPNGGTSGVFVSDTKIIISTNAQWDNIAAGDSLNVSDWRRFKLLSDRNTSYTRSNPERVIIGKPPVILNYDLNGTNLERDYERDNHKISILGTDLQLVEYIEIVDESGKEIINPISVVRVARSPYLQSTNPVQHSVSPNQIELNATIWTNYPDLGYADSISGISAPTTGLGKMDGRRLRVMNVFSLATPVYSSGLDTFTVSARPDFTHDLSRTFNQPVYHGGRGTLAEEEHWIDLNGSNPLANSHNIELTVNPGPTGPLNPDFSGSLRGVRNVYFESNRTGVWTVQRMPSPFPSMVNGVPFNYDTARFDINASGMAANGGIQISDDGRTISLLPWFVQAFNLASSDLSIPIAERARRGAGIDGFLNTADDWGYWNENDDTGVGRAVMHRVRFETVAGPLPAPANWPVARTDESADGGFDNGLFYTYINAMEEGVGAYIRLVHGPGYIAGGHWERNSTLHVTGPGLDNARMLRFIDADQNATIASTSVAGINDQHGWINMAAVGITPVALPGTGGAPNEWTLVIPGDLGVLADDGHLIDSASDTLAELRRVEVMFLDGTTKRSTLHAFTISRPLEWDPGATADTVFEQDNPDDPFMTGGVRGYDGLYFSKYDTFGLRPGKFLKVSGVDWHNNMRGVQRIDFVDNVGNTVHGGPNNWASGIDFNSTDPAADGINNVHSWVAAGDSMNFVTPGAAPNGGADNLASRASFLYLPDTMFTDASRSGWFEGSDINAGTRRLLFTMRSGAQTLSPAIRAGRAPTFIGLNTGGATQPQQEQGFFWSQIKTIAFDGVSGNYAFNRVPVAPDATTHIDINATDINQTVFQKVWFELADDQWPFGNSTADIPDVVNGGLGQPGPEIDDFPGTVRQYPAGQPIIGATAYVERADVAPGGVWGALSTVPVTSLIANIPGQPLGIHFDGSLWDAHARYGGNDSPGDDETTFGIRLSRQVVVETMFGQASSFREVVNPADAKVLSVSTLWDFFPFNALDGTPVNIGHINAELNATFELNSTDPTIPNQNGWNGNTSVAVLDANNNLVINTPTDLFANRIPIAGGVRALRFDADNNGSQLILEHDDWNTVGGLGVIINRAFYVSADLTQIVVNGDYVVEAIRANPGGAEALVFRTPLASVAGPPGTNGGGVYMQIIGAADQHVTPGGGAAPLIGGQPNVIGPFGTQ